MGWRAGLDSGWRSAILIKLMMSVDAIFLFVSLSLLRIGEKRRGAKTLDDAPWAAFLPKSPRGCSVGACASLHPSAADHLLSRPNGVSVCE